VWQALLNNFVIEAAAFSGAEIGILQSLREIPGFLSFTVILVLWWTREQRLALLALATMCLGVAMTGLFPSATGLYYTTILMSVGFHYFETLNQSLTLQWVDKHQSAHFLGKMLSVRAAAALLAFGGIWLLMEQWQMSYRTMYLVTGGLGLLIVLVMALWFPAFEQPHPQHQRMLLRRRYWLYYGLTFLSGARRQIFVVFAGFMMVEKFGYSVGEISLLYMVNHLINLFFAPTIGKWIGRLGERLTLRIEYIGLVLVFSGYAVVENGYLAAGLYIVDHLFFAMAIAIKTYFQKIADPRDLAATAGVSFTINHIAAVVIPALLGLLWLHSPTAVFLTGSAIAIASLLLASLVPSQPAPGREHLWSAPKAEPGVQYKG